MTEHFQSLLDELLETFIQKNSDYGGSVDITYLMFGDTAPLVRLWDKLLRATQLHIAGASLVKSESYEDTLKDLANYAAIYLAQKRTYKGNVDELGEQFKQFVQGAVDKRRNN